jgi:predicted membrane protein
MKKGTRTFIWGILLMIIGAIAFSSSISAINKHSTHDLFFWMGVIAIPFNILTIYYGFWKVEQTVK